MSNSIGSGPNVPVNISDFNPDNPIIGQHNLVTAGNVEADTEADGYPASNVANPATYSSAGWRADDATEQYFTVDLSGADAIIDYVGIAAHNFGTAGIAFSVEVNVGAGWVEEVEPQLRTDDAPLLLRLELNVYTGVRIKLAAGFEAARIGVLYVGRALILQRRVAVGHTPITLSAARKSSTGMSESGNFMGRILSGGKAETTVPLANLDAGWYREHMKPFIDQAEEAPFFFAWRPQGYPREIGYVWLTATPKPKTQRTNGMMSIELPIAGIIS